MNLAEELKNIQLSFYKQGFVHLKNIFSKSEIINLRKSFIKYKKNQNKNLIKVLHIEKKIKNVKKIMSHSYLLYLLKFILKMENIVCLQTEAFFNPPKTKGYGLHQDDYFLATGKNNSANLWIPLVKTNRNNGSLKFLKNSNKLKILKKKNRENLESTNENKYKKSQIINVNCNIGDAILISNTVFHGSGRNNSKTNRYVLAVGYMREGSKFRKGFTAKRKPFKIS